MKLPFVKMSGAGNDFVVVESARIPAHDDAGLGRLARFLCRRRLSVGADGLIVLEPMSADRVRMVYYNADGSRAAMCGNGGRSAARYARWRGWAGGDLTLEADDGSHPATVKGERVRLGMTEPKWSESEVELRHGDQVYRGLSVDTGVPHLVLWVEELGAVDVETVGRAFRFDPRFQPEGTNVDFAESLGPSALSVRTYERGVEGETLACGTGVVAAAVAAFIEKGARPPLEVRAVGGTLAVGFRSEGRRLSGITLEGDARITFEGQVDLAELETGG